MSKEVVVVEDNIGIKEKYVRLLKLGGFEVTAFSSKEQVLEHNGDQEFDLAIIDGLKGDCFDLYDEINAKRKVILTGDDRIYQEAIEKGYEARLKPCSVLDLTREGVKNE